MIKKIYITQEELNILIQFREVTIPEDKDGKYIQIIIKEKKNNE